MLRRALLNAQRLVKSSAIANRTTTIIRPQYGWVSRFSSTNISNAQSLEMDLSTGESKRRLFNRLLYRSQQRGFLELDLVLGKWENPDLWRWLTGQERPPEAVSVQEKVRATPGQPCVRGWDDFRKGHDVPITGGEKFLWRNLNSILE
ncbi:hypothetical protein Gorai_017948 [Gossypium raimondii]|uniref:Succinate dehydrogenase assembly factor 2, mitochondrial n=1 Tax=Gossypium raimondii TaxID=29730 RepID=A0A7J8PJB0_GOSRA|nr:hypothetical protein [Gossypium raimondii]